MSISSARAALIPLNSCIRNWPTWRVSASRQQSRTLKETRTPSRPCWIRTIPSARRANVHFATTKTTLWKTAPNRCHLNWVVCDSDWEAEFCRVADSHPRVNAYVKNQGLGLEVPYRSGSIPRTYLPDFIVLVDDGRGEDDPLHLIIEIKGHRGEDAKDKKATMETYWVPGVNQRGGFGRWAFAELTDFYQIETAFNELVDGFLVEYDTV